MLGLLAGFVYRPFGIAAAAGAAVLLAGAIVVHARRDALGKDVVPAAVVLTLAIATLIVKLIA